ncbi:hypothetical protein [Clostridium folliculivorans]|nr:hypothetical protein [Clostridium folliculivorans]
MAGEPKKVMRMNGLLSGNVINSTKLIIEKDIEKKRYTICKT